jgi:heat-inducible transcriptional repressor
MTDQSLNQRAQQILKILVERYIQDGSPIGSKTIAEEYSLGMSPATIRHILADLENAGYLASPHTSSGRVPTSMGYRVFVNSLLTTKPIENVDVSTIQTQLDSELTMTHLLKSASTLLSDVTKLIGVVALPRRNRIELRHVEFLPLSGQRVLVILVLKNREVQNRIIHTEKMYSQNELQQAANYLNTHYVGKDLTHARKELKSSMQKDRENMGNLLRAAIEMGSKAFECAEESSKDYVIAGQNNFLNYTSETSLEQLRALFEAFSQKQEILNLLDQSLEAEGIQIFIGKESGYEVFGDCSIVTTSYSVGDQLIGSLGVIGPIRMPYDRVIPAVDVTAKLLSAALNQD